MSIPRLRGAFGETVDQRSDCYRPRNAIFYPRNDNGIVDPADYTACRDKLGPAAPV